jgi:gamma-glutamyl-gamma-aminobutyrate hydrolase PuuD
MKIGIVGNVQNERFGCNEDYVKLMSEFGSIGIISPDMNVEDVLVNYNAVLLPGGADVYFARYTKIPSWFAGKPDLLLEKFDTSILPELIGEIPIIGICRGIANFERSSRWNSKTALIFPSNV